MKAHQEKETMDKAKAFTSKLKEKGAEDWK